MKTTLLAVAVMAAGIPTEDAMADPLAEYRWKNRVLLVFSSSSDDEMAREMRRSITDYEVEFADRDLVAGWIYDDEPGQLAGKVLGVEHSESLRDAAGIADDDFQVLLVGKDGGVKSRYGSPPALDDVLALIDSMPMRRAEMRRRAPGSAQ